MADNQNQDPQLIKEYLDLMQKVYGISKSIADVEASKNKNLKEEIKLLEQKLELQKKGKSEYEELTKELNKAFNFQQKQIFDTKSAAEKLINTYKKAKDLDSSGLKFRLAEIKVEKEAAAIREKQIASRKKYLQEEIEQRKKLTTETSKKEIGIYEKQLNKLKEEEALLQNTRSKYQSQESYIEKKIPAKRRDETTATLLGTNAGKTFTENIKKDKGFGKALFAGIGVGILGLASPTAAAQKAAATGATAPMKGGSGGGKGGGGTPSSTGAGSASGGGGSAGGKPVTPSDFFKGGGTPGNVLDKIPSTGNPYVDASVKVASAALERFKKVDAEFKEPLNLARSLNTTYDNALKARVEMTLLASATNNVFVTGEKMAKATIAMNEQLGVAVNYDAKRLVFQTQLRNQLKGSAEEVKSTSDDLLKTSLTIGDQRQTEEAIFKSRLAQVRLVKIQQQTAIDERKVLMDIAKASNSIRINYLGSDEALTKAAASARALGTEISKMDKAASSLLNFEESIKDQMEAELLTGKNLNLEKARYYALTNDIGGLTQELNNQGIDAVKYGQMNRLAQESYAKALGMTREEMSDMLMQQRLLTALKTDDLAKAKEEYKQAILLGKGKEFLDKLGDKALADQFDQMSMQERMAASQEKMAMAMEALAVSMAGPIYKGLVLGAETTATLLNLPQGALADKQRASQTSPVMAAVPSTKREIYPSKESYQYRPGYAPMDLSSLQGLDDGGLVKQSGVAKVDKGELYLGANSAAQMNRMVALLEQLVNKPGGQSNNPIVLKVNDQVLASSVAYNASTVPGNLLNPGSSTYS